MKKLSSFLSNVWLGLSTHKLRSFLTMLGVVIGVAAVIILMSIGQGTSASILSRLQGLGANLLFISPGQTVTTGGVRTGFGSASTLTLEDAAAIYQDVPSVAEVAPSNSASLQVIAGAQNTRTRISGVTLEYQDAYTLQMAEGDFISQDQYDSAMKVAVLGPNVSSTLFPDSDPVGQSVRIGNSVATVIGVLQSKGQSLIGSTDDSILIPLTTLQQIAAQPLTATGGHVVSSIVVSVTDKQYIDQVMADITTLLQERHNIDPTVGNDFTVTSIQDLTNTITQATNSITLLLGAIAAISLLVGGIGVMNIMLVSVLERTREIGIRKALGARESDIWIQFLIEAASLTLTGGIIGVIVGWGGSYLVSHFSSISTLVSANIVILAVSVSIGIGLFFGFYPAWNASRLDPIQALRSE
jgi:putative ABC transport system permease protein